MHIICIKAVSCKLLYSELEIMCLNKKTQF